MKRVVYGAGSGGTLLANLLANEFHKEVGVGDVSVQLVGEGDEHAFEPGNLDIVFRGADPMSIIRKEGALLKKGVDHTSEGAASVDMKAKVLTTRKGSKYPYDYIVFATGAVARPELMPGLDEGSLNFHTDGAAALRSGRLYRFQGWQGGGSHHECTPQVPAIAERGLVHARRVLPQAGKQRVGRDQVLTPYPRAYPAEHISEVVQPMFEKRGIETVPFFAADHVDPGAKKIYSLESDSQDYHLLIAVPPHRGAEVILASGIGDEEGWISADKHTMRMKDHPEAYALGDATNISISKSGVVADLQAEAVARTSPPISKGVGITSNTTGGSTVRWRRDDGGRCSSPEPTRSHLGGSSQPSCAML